MEYKNTVVADPKIMLGKPVIKGTRITVEIILKKLSEGMNIDEFISAITKNDILAALSDSADVISKEEIILV